MQRLRPHRRKLDEVRALVAALLPDRRGAADAPLDGSLDRAVRLSRRLCHPLALAAAEQHRRQEQPGKACVTPKSGLRTDGVTS